MEEVTNLDSEKEKKSKKKPKPSQDGDSAIAVSDADAKDIEKSPTPSDSIADIESIPLDSLLYDAEEEYEEYESDEAEKFEAFLADYKEIMAETLAAAKNESQEISIDIPESSDIEAEPQENDVADESDAITTENESDRYSENNIVLVEPEEEATEEISDGIDAEDESDGEESVDDDYDGEQMEMDFGEPENTDAKDAKEESRESDKYDPEHPRRIDTVFEFVELFIFTFVAVMIATTFFFRHAIVDGPSMQNTLQNNDRLIIYSFLYEPERGDVVVFTHEKTLVKRVIAIEGDTVEVKCLGRICEVWVNGEKLDEDYVHIDGDITAYVGEYIVGEDEVFVLGDHRNNSTDSRVFGTVSEDAILGKVVLRFYPEFTVIK